jgi:phosphatidyl-myo-inositol alpha-mannosyltransferase
MGASEPSSSGSRAGAGRRVAAIVAVVVLGALLAFAISRLDFERIGHALITASPGWLALALALMAASLLLRSASWQQTLRAALPDAPIPWRVVLRSTMIGVMASALFPGRLGEPTRVIVLARRVPGSRRLLLPIIAGTVFSQTLINLLALAALAVVTFTAVPLANGHLTAVGIALAIPLAICALVIAGPRLLALGEHSRWRRLAHAAEALARMLRLARRGLVVFARPRYGVPAVTVQLLAWAFQWLSCYSVLLALGLADQAGLAGAAAILLAVNVSAVLPATPSNVGVFQAACLVVLAAYGVGAGPSLAYGIILQAIEILTAVGLGIPALLGEGLTWSELRSGVSNSAGEGAE